MVRITDKKRGIENIRFYDALAAEYDRMTDFESRFAKERPFFQKLLQQYGLRTALDAGCGTGFHSLLLSQLGLRVTAADISQKMLKQTRKNAKELGLYIKTIGASLTELKAAVNNKFDSIFCLGNTFAHILTEKELLCSLQNFYQVLNSGGIVCIQILNYERIIKQGKRIQNIREADGKIFVRFYDYGEKNIRFNIIIIEKRKGMSAYLFNSVQLRPWKAPEIVRLFRRIGYRKVKIFGNIEMDVYNKRISKDLVVLAQK